MIKWGAWYEDAFYSSDDCDWSELPDKVQIVKIIEEAEYSPGKHYSRTLDGKDWYYRAPDGRIEAVASVSWDGYRPKPCYVPEKDIKRGTGVDDATFVRLTEEARQWQ